MIYERKCEDKLRGSECDATVQTNKHQKPYLVFILHKDNIIYILYSLKFFYHCHTLAMECLSKISPAWSDYVI